MITKPEIQKMMLQVAKLFKENATQLSEIDARFGDGDHGITINKIALVIESNTNNWSEESIKSYFSLLGKAILGVNGGSAGPLYGTMVGGLVESMKEDTKKIDAKTLKEMFSSSLSEMQCITTAKVGDKTMMDALIPAVEAAKKAPDEVKEILILASLAAEEGAKNSERFIAKFGRARSYKEQTIGTPDAGAMSTSLFFKGLVQGYIGI